MSTQADATASGSLDPSLVPAVPAGGRFEGLLTFRGSARIEGRLDGEVIARGRLEVAEGAEIHARISVDELVVAGAVEGEIHARFRAELLPSAQVRGTLRSPLPVLAEGCRFEGRCHTESSVVEPVEDAPESPQTVVSP